MVEIMVAVIGMAERAERAKRAGAFAGRGGISAVCGGDHLDVKLYALAAEVEGTLVYRVMHPNAEEAICKLIIAVTASGELLIPSLLLDGGAEEVHVSSGGLGEICVKVLRNGIGRALGLKKHIGVAGDLIAVPEAARGGKA